MPAWIREGLEKMEREKQKKIDRERQIKEREEYLQKKREEEENAINELEKNSGQPVIPKKSKFVSILVWCMLLFVCVLVLYLLSFLILSTFSFLAFFPSCSSSSGHFNLHLQPLCYILVFKAESIVGCLLADIHPTVGTCVLVKYFILLHIIFLTIFLLKVWVNYIYFFSIKFMDADVFRALCLLECFHLQHSECYLVCRIVLFITPEVQLVLVKS